MGQKLSRRSLCSTCGLWCPLYSSNHPHSQSLGTSTRAKMCGLNLCNVCKGESSYACCLDSFIEAAPACFRIANATNLLNHVSAPNLSKTCLTLLLILTFFKTFLQGAHAFLHAATRPSGLGLAARIACTTCLRGSF